jgi:hypothetical protein
MENQENIIIKPVDKNNWLDFESLFQSKGILRTCWCMHWRMTKEELKQNNPACRKEHIKQRVWSNTHEEMGFEFVKMAGKRRHVMTYKI